MSVPINRLGLEGDEMVDILNIRGNAQEIIDNKNIFPAYHMNKKSWVSILLNNFLKDEYVFCLLNESYKIAKGRKE